MKKIKHIFYLLMAFFFFLHFLFPICIYFFQGFTQSYQAQYFERSSVLKGISLNLLSLIIGSAFIYLTPFHEKSILSNHNLRSRLYLIISIIFSCGALATIGNFASSLKSLHQPTGFFIFGNMFLNLDYYFLFSLALASDFIASSQIFYVIRNIFGASRSASLSLLLFLFYTSWSSNAKSFLKRYLFYFAIALSLSFFSFNWATNVRRQAFKKDLTTSEKVIQSLAHDRSSLDRIIGRVSYLEAAMLPIIHKDQDLPNLKIFYDKYSIMNQLKLIANNLVPGDIFPSDVMPNQYYRSAFMNMPIQIAQENYTSINMTLPVYFYMYFNFFTTVLITGFFIWIYYVITILGFNLHPLIGSVFIYYFYSYFLSFFDLTSLVKFIAAGILAIPIFIICSKTELIASNFIITKRQARPTLL